MDSDERPTSGGRRRHQSSPSGPVAPVIDDLHCQFTHIISKKRPVYILGDANFDTSCPAKAGVREYSRLLDDLSHNQLITSPPRPGPNPSLVDQFITNRPDLTSDPRVVKANISDHDLIAVSVAGVIRRHPPRTVTVRSTRRLNQDALRLDMLLADWDPVYHADGTSAKWDAWRSVWDPLIDQLMPLRQVQLKHQSQPWLYNKGVKAAMEARSLARLAWRIWLPRRLRCHTGETLRPRPRGLSVSP